MTNTDPAGLDNQATDTHRIPVFALNGNPLPPGSDSEFIPTAFPGLWFSSGKGPDGTARLYRVDDVESPIYGHENDRDNRDRHMLRAMLLHTLDMLTGQDNS